jgi:hypothetical protein
MQCWKNKSKHSTKEKQQRSKKKKKTKNQSLIVPITPFSVSQYSVNHAYTLQWSGHGGQRSQGGTAKKSKKKAKPKKKRIVLIAPFSVSQYSVNHTNTLHWSGQGGQRSQGGTKKKKKKSVLILCSKFTCSLSQGLSRQNFSGASPLSYQRPSSSVLPSQNSFENFRK